MNALTLLLILGGSLILHANVYSALSSYIDPPRRLATRDRLRSPSHVLGLVAVLSGAFILIVLAELGQIALGCTAYALLMGLDVLLLRRTLMKENASDQERA